MLERAAQILPTVVADEDELDARLVSEVLDAEHTYSEACVSFCDLAPRCHAEAVRRGDAAILGDDMRRFVGGTPLKRAAELLAGAGPVDEAEADLARRLREEAKGLLV